MLASSAAAARSAATLPLFLPQPPADKVSGLIHAATLLAQLLGQGRALDSRALRSAMESAFAASDAEGAWVWKDAYEALEAAQVLFLRKSGAAMRARAGSPAAMLELLTRLTERLPSHTRRSEESERLQQFSTPVTLGFVAAEAAALTPSDLVLEPSAGTGLLAIFAELAGARLALNEIAETRAGLLGRLFRDTAPPSRHNAEQIHDRLDPAVRPSVVLMNPPFSASPHIEGRFAETALRHVASAFARLAEGGRLVAVTGHNVGPDQPAWREGFVRLQEKGRVVFTATLAGQAYARHGTAFDTRLTVIDRVPAENPRAFPASPGMATGTSDLLEWVTRLVPPRPPLALPSPSAAPLPARLPVPTPTAKARQLRTAGSPHGLVASASPVPPPVLTAAVGQTFGPEATELVYETCEWTPGSSAARLTASLYEGYALQALRIAEARPHPTKLVQSAAMAAVAPPRPSYRPHLPLRLISAGILSDAQIESVIYAGEVHGGYLAGSYT
ncbi:MAG: strawberry notch-like NTP hydrolase domain-containing protein, partial [Acetobacteraceae bacterium]